MLLDNADRPVALNLERWSDQGQRLTFGLQTNGRIRALRPDQGGAFIETDTGPEAFMRLPNAHRLTEGQAVRVTIASEARGDKLPRAELLNDKTPAKGQLVWSNGATEDVAPGDPIVAAAFDEALSSALTLPRGGRLRIERTHALTSVDIDTAGRQGTGSAASRALQINLEACRELARQLKLRKLGGLVVLDCVAPLNAGSRQKIKDAMKSELRAADLTSSTILAPSQLGLMEMSLPWRETPICDRLQNNNGDASDETLCLEGLRILEQAATQNRLDRYTLELPERAYDWLEKVGRPLKDLLADKYGQRLIFQGFTKSKPSVYKSP